MAVPARNETMVQDVNEAIDVISVFREGNVQPVKFKWAGRTLTVSRIAYAWVTRQGSHPQYHFSLLTGGREVYEIVFNSFRVTWTLVRVHVA